MPAGVSEVGAGAQFSRSTQENQTADAATRTFRIVLNDPQEVLDIQSACQIAIGSPYPGSADLVCVSYDARYEGSSRMVVLATFNYQQTPGGPGLPDPKLQPPDVRPANWTISSSLIEIPLWNFFAERTGAQAWGGGGVARNPARDMYEGLIGLDAMVTISIQQFEPNDPTRHARHVGAINSESITLGSLEMIPHTVMLRGVTAEPVVQSWGDLIYRGWNCRYEFGYKSNVTSIWIGTDQAGGRQEVELGWDMAVPQTGFNVICFNPPGNARQNPYGQPLKFDDDGAIDDPLALPENVVAGRKQRAMVEVPFNNKSSQAPSASPIPLNDDGTPRAADLFPIVRGYQVLRDINITQTLGLRLN